MSQGSDEWYDQPRALAGITLYRLREKMREKNLHDTEEPPLETSATPPTGDAYNVRTADGKYNDLKCPRMEAPASGSDGTCRSRIRFRTSPT